VDDENDDDVVARAVHDLVERTRFSVGFGGLLRDGEVVISKVVGHRTRSLHGLRVQPARGLGGIALVEQRSRMTPDYRASTRITHDYDRQVLGEGITTLLAVPILVDGEARGILYGGSWNGTAMHGVTAAPAFQIADEAATELRVRDEVRRRLARATPRDTALSAADREMLRGTWADLRSVAAAVEDAALRDRIHDIERRLGLIGVAADPAPDASDMNTEIRLAPRELDVLANVALGRTNQEIADALGLRAGTVKAYLGTAMSKLEASTRHAAVANARRAGILP